jgi:hypothetical protein
MLKSMDSEEEDDVLRQHGCGLWNATLLSKVPKYINTVLRVARVMTTIGPTINTQTGCRITTWRLEMKRETYTPQASSTSAVRRDESYADLTLTTAMPCGSSGV